MKLYTGKLIGVLTATLGFIMAGCSTTDEYAERQETMTVVEAAGSEPQPQTEFTGEDIVIPLHEEQLNVGKKAVEGGQVTIRKIVTSETVSEPVELRKENVTIERRSVADAESSAAMSSNALGAPFEEGTITIQLQSEEPVVEKRTVTTSEVVARKNVEWDKQTVQRDVRREDIAVDKTADIVESAGAGIESDIEE